MKPSLSCALLASCFPLFVSGFASAQSAPHASSLRSDLPGSEARAKLSLPEETPSLVRNIREASELGGFSELLPFVLASPNQEDAGSCLYMATTGVAEWWLARLNPYKSRRPNGPVDLSERYLMNMAGIDENETQLENWRTDSIYLFNNNAQKSHLNKDYPYTKGWFKEATATNPIVAATPHEPGAEYGTSFNWVSNLDSLHAPSIALPFFERKIIFADPEKNQWNIGIAPHDIAQKVKTALVESKAPVMVIYNHHGYWHAVYIVGYNDELENGNCSYTEKFREKSGARILELEKSLRNAKTEEERQLLEARLRRSREASAKLENAYASHGGCTSNRGVFYVRDSIYPDENGPIYDYDPTTSGDEAPYTKKIVLKEYDWLHYFANNIVLITAKNLR